MWPEGKQGKQWTQWETWPAGNWVASITSSKSGKITTVTITETNGNSDSFTVSDGADGQWSGDVLWPDSSTDWHLAVFDWTSWKMIKDWWSVPVVPTNVSDFNNDAWYITWIDSTDVTTALWYTPYDDSNPDWYISWIDSTDVTTALGYTPVNPSSLWTAASKDTWTSAWNVPVLDSNWKLNTTILPWVALTDTFTVTNKSDLTSLSTAEQWDIGIVTSESKTYVLSAEPYSTAANWTELLSPTDAVTSVNSKTWAVTLNADDIDDTNTTNKFVTASDKSTWSGKQDALTLPATPTNWHLVAWWSDNKTLTDWWAIPTGVPSWWTDWQVLSKVSGNIAWANPSGWDVKVSTQANNILTSWMKIWAGTQANYESLGTYDNNTVYLTI
jgi:hypothetical protein